jgi:hypothetical protein
MLNMQEITGSLRNRGRRPFYRVGGHFISGNAGRVPFWVESRNKWIFEFM